MKKLQEEEIPQGYVRVSTVLSPYTNFDGAPADVVANAADRGTLVHKLCELYALDLFIPNIRDDCKGYFESFKKWFDSRVKEVIFTEQRLNSPTYKLSGQIDFVLKINGSEKLCLVDIKTPAVASKKWQLQTAAYQILFKDCLGEDIPRRFCLMLKKDGSNAVAVEYTDTKNDQEFFLNALILHRFFERRN
mgnify:CR=1 FL=1